MARRRNGVALAMAVVAATVLAGCGQSTDTGGATQQRDRASSPDAPSTGGHGADSQSAVDAAETIDAALAARTANDAVGFAGLVREVGLACADPASAGRLDEVAAIADRWASALADGRPKVQAVTEQQLAEVPWDDLRDACS